MIYFLIGMITGACIGAVTMGVISANSTEEEKK